MGRVSCIFQLGPMYLQGPVEDRQEGQWQKKGRWDDGSRGEVLGFGDGEDGHKPRNAGGL